MTFAPLPYPSSKKPPLLDYQLEAGARLGAAKNETRGLSSSSIANLLSLYRKNTFNIPIPASGALFAEHATAPFFVFQIFCVALWCLDEYWYYSLFTLFMLIMFECTVVWQRVRTLTEFRSMSIEPYPIQCYRDGKWVKVQTDELLPGDAVSLGKCLCSPKEFLYKYTNRSPPSASEYRNHHSCRLATRPWHVYCQRSHALG